MEIRALTKNDLPAVVACMNIAFEGYFVKIPDTVEFWEGRYERARVDYSLSFAAFDKERVVAFVINGVDYRGAMKTAFNTGTGVLPDYRGRKLVDQIYAKAIPLFRAANIRQCQLEVIDKNARGIRVYERIGFKIIKRLKCLRGTYNGPKHPMKLIPVDFRALYESGLPGNSFHSWDNNHQALLAAEDYYDTYEVRTGTNRDIGYFVIRPENGYLPQFEADSDDLEYLFSGISQLAEVVRINNVDDGRSKLMFKLLEFGFENTIDQFEMGMEI